MDDLLKKDVTVTISRLELVHGELRSRYERAKDDYETLHKRYMEAISEFEKAKNDYALVDRALKAMDALRDDKPIDDIDDAEEDCYF